MHPFQLALPQLCLLQVPVQRTTYMFCLVILAEDIHMDTVVFYTTGQSLAPSDNDKTSKNGNSSKCLARHP